MIPDQTKRPLRAIVLAAGKGKRLHSEATSLPKVLRQAAGRPLLAWVLDNLSFIAPEDTTIVVGYQADKVRQAMGSRYPYVLQDQQLGTGHAVACAAEVFRGFSGDVLVVYGDMPLFDPGTYQMLAGRHRASGAACSLLTAKTAALQDYGRIIRDEAGQFIGIVEKKDCTPEQALIDEVNPGVYVFQSSLLFETLQHIRANNAQGEYYLTDVPVLIRAAGLPVETVTIADDRQIIGVNNEEDLAACEKILQETRPQALPAPSRDVRLQTAEPFQPSAAESD
jgi:UDP-N-acetylglucosamine diphosphorylase/glucosamine-1-phosphate N-acetyltransferase